MTNIGTGFFWKNYKCNLLQLYNIFIHLHTRGLEKSTTYFNNSLRLNKYKVTIFY